MGYSAAIALAALAATFRNEYEATVLRPEVAEGKGGATTATTPSVCTYTCISKACDAKIACEFECPST